MTRNLTGRVNHAEQLIFEKNRPPSVPPQIGRGVQMRQVSAGNVEACGADGGITESTIDVEHIIQCPVGQSEARSTPNDGWEKVQRALSKIAARERRARQGICISRHRSNLLVTHLSYVEPVTRLLLNSGRLWVRTGIYCVELNVSRENSAGVVMCRTRMFPRYRKTESTPTNDAGTAF
jgi:hypothetical protein